MRIDRRENISGRAIKKFFGGGQGGGGEGTKDSSSNFIKFWRQQDGGTLLIFYLTHKTSLAVPIAEKLIDSVWPHKSEDCSLNNPELDLEDPSIQA